MNDVLLEVNNISKRFGATQALKNAGLVIRKGTIHSLLGRNGAGKSTVVNIIAGIFPQDNGEVIYKGKVLKNESVFKRQEMGIRMVTQHASVIPELTVAENIFMGLWPKNKHNLVDWKKMHQMAQDELDSYGLHVDPGAKVKTLSPVDMRKVNIVRAMYGGAELVILDEPTTALSSKEREELFGFINELKAKGTAFIFISHYLNEVVRLSDDITVIRDGMSFQTDEKESVTEEALANLIAGEDVSLTTREKIKENIENDLILECKNINSKRLNNVSMKLYKGQILGIVGFPGSGAREICRALFGLEKVTAGKIYLKGKKLDIKNPSVALKKKIAYISHDRHHEGIVSMLQIKENIALPILNTALKGKLGLLDTRKETEISAHYCDMLKVKSNSVYDKLSSLSGGNQQKVVVGKALSSQPEILILDEPTVGIDIKSREEIIAIVDELTKKGLSVIYLTNDFDELTRIADRLIFFNEGQLGHETINNDLTQDDVVNIRDSLTEQKPEPATA